MLGVSSELKLEKHSDIASGSGRPQDFLAAAGTMFNRISSKLRSRAGGNKDKSFAYGKMQKHDLASQADFTNSEPDSQPVSSWDEDNGYREEEEAGGSPRSHAESFFPLEPVVEQQQSNNRSYVENYHGDPEESVSSDSFYLEENTKKSLPGSSSLPDQEINIGPAVLPEYDDAEEDFLGLYDEYFDHLSVDIIRKEQYPKLDSQRLIYLDYARCGLYSLSQVEEHMRLLMEEGPCLGSADSNALSYLSNHVGDAQDCILRLLNTDRATYSIVFTTGFSATYRLVGESYPFQKNTPLLICQDNHEAVRNLIALAVGSGAKPVLVPIGESDLSLQATELRKLLGRHTRHHSNGGLFVFPAQSCATGVLHSVNWVAEAQQNGWQVLIDASTYLPAGYLDLTLYQPEFVGGSIVHLLGYPSGIGFLLVRKEAFKVQATSFVDKKLKMVPVTPASGQQERDCVIVDDDNALSPLSFAAVHIGLRHLESVGHAAIQKRVRSLLAWLLQALLSLRHKGEPGAPLTQVYGPLSTRNRGNIIAFNVLDSTGTGFPPGLVHRLALKNNIVLGSGNLSSPGVTNLLGKASERVKDVSVFEPRKNALHEQGSVRVSLGPMSTFRDVYMLAHFLSRFRDEDYLSGEAMDYYEESSAERFP